MYAACLLTILYSVPAVQTHLPVLQLLSGNNIGNITLSPVLLEKVRGGSCHTPQPGK